MCCDFPCSLLVVLSLAERVHPLYLQRFWQSPISQSRYIIHVNARLIIASADISRLCYIYMYMYIDICWVDLVLTITIHIRAHTHTHRSLRTQLLLWPSRPLSLSSHHHSPTLSRLVFTSHTGIAYAHITQRVYPLKTSAATSAELTEISSTVSDPTKRNEQNDAKNSNKNTLLNGSESFGRNDYEKTLASDGTVEVALNGDMKVSENAHGDDGGVLKEGTADTGQPVLKGRSSSECRPCGEYHCVYTDLPKFLITYSPKVHISYQPLPLHW